MNLYLTDLNLMDATEIDYSYNYNCEDSGCNEEGICRCGSVEDEHLKSVDTEKIIKLISDRIFINDITVERDYKISEALGDGISKEIDFYTLDRVCRILKIWNNLEISIEAGYYGDEVGGIFLFNKFSEKLTENLSKAFSTQSLKERVELLLKLEYGELIDLVKDKTWSVIEINIDEVDMGNKNYFDKVLKELKVKDNYSNYDTGKIQGVVVNSSGKFRLIDGYHRIAKLKRTNYKGLVKVLVGS